MKFDLKNFLKALKLNESTISAALGAIVILVVAVFVINYFKGKDKTGTITSNAVSTVEQTATVSKTHVVARGESLWQIAEKYYGSGYKWIEIAKENKLANPGLITDGQQLILPATETIETKLTPGTSNSISGSTYQVVKGDTLWNIAVRAYGDGFKWPQIADENKLTNPNLIHPGNILAIPRK